jgi:hypothetical protein
MRALWITRSQLLDKPGTCHAVPNNDDAAHWSTFLMSTFSNGASMHPGCHQVTALLA